MARNANPSTRPPESLAAGSTALGEVVAEVLEMANYAVTHARQVLFSISHTALGLQLAPPALTEYLIPCWVDEDVLSYEFTVRSSIPAGNAILASFTDDAGTDTFTLDDTHETMTITRTNPLTATSGQGRATLFSISFAQSAGSDPVFVTEMQLRATLGGAGALPAPGEA